MNRRGFTLIELMLALAISAVVIAAVYTSFFTVQRALSGGEETMQRLHEARICLETLRREVEGAFLGSSTDDPFAIADRNTYDARTSEIGFTTDASVLAIPAKVRYFVRERQDKSLVLMKSVKPSHQGDDTPAQEAELIEGIESFSVSGRRGDQWLSTWEYGTPPEEVMVEIVASIKGQPLPLTLKVTPKVGTTR